MICKILKQYEYIYPSISIYLDEDNHIEHCIEVFCLTGHKRRFYNKETLFSINTDEVNVFYKILEELKEEEI